MIIVLFRYKTRILFLNRVLRKLSSIIILNSSLLKHYFLRIIGSEVEVSCSHTHLPASTPLSLKRVDPLVLDPLLCQYQSNNQLASTCRPYHNYPFITAIIQAWSLDWNAQNLVVCCVVSQPSPESWIVIVYQLEFVCLRGMPKLESQAKNDVICCIGLLKRKLGGLLLCIVFCW